MSKKGQITIFIVLGVIILSATLLVLYIRSILVKPEVEAERAAAVPLEAQPMQIFVEDCLKRIGENGLLTIGLQGGYVRFPNRYLQTDLLTIPYFYYEDERNIPELENVSRQIDFYLKLFLPTCLEEFKTFRAQGYSISMGEITSKTIFGDKETIINLNYPLTFERAGSEIKLADFSTKIVLPYKSLYSIATQIADQQNRSKGMIDSIFLDSFGKNITTLGFENNTVVFLITDESKIRGVNYQFIFATKVSR